MAYGNIYYAGFQSLGVKGTLYIDKLDYASGATKLTLVKDSLTIAYKFDDWENPVIPLQCEFSIVNEKLDFFELLPLMMAEEREYQIRVVLTTPVAYTAFQGYLNCEPVGQKYLHRQIIDFVASNYLMKLDDVHPVSIDTLQNRTFIDVINEILLSTGSTFNIRVNAILHAEGDTPSSSQTLFNLNGFFTEVFWTDNVERNTSLEILTSILRTFNCYIYWWQGYWYIERYDDLWNESISYVEYDSATAYDPADSGSVVAKAFTVGDLNDNVFTETTQTLEANPGMKTVKITLQDQRFLNLINDDLLNAYSSYVYTDIPNPNYREWLTWGQSGLSWGAWGEPKSNIVNAISRTMDLYGVITPERGLYCKFKTTIVSKEDQINITFKYCLNKESMHPNLTNYEKQIFKFHWYLHLLPNNDFIGNTEDVWKIDSADTEISWVQETIVNGSQFDPDTNTVEVNIDIPIGAVKDYRAGYNTGSLTGDQTFVLCIGSETVVSVDDNNGETAELQPTEAWYGDILVTSTGADQDNVIEGTTNTKYLNKLDIDLDLYDSETFDYRNAILRGSVLEKRTERWGTTGGLTEIVARGICWSSHTSPPTIEDDHYGDSGVTEDGTGYGVFVSQMYGLEPITAYDYRAYATDALGNTEYGDTKTLITDVLAIGVHHEGGIIGYIFQPERTVDGVTIPEDAGYVTGEIHGIIVNEKDSYSEDVWCRIRDSTVGYTTGANGYEVGDGTANTAAMIAQAYAATFAVHYIVVLNATDTFTGWYLPSILELEKFVEYKNVLGFVNNWYWSSTEEEWNVAWAVNFAMSVANGTECMKNTYMRIRACRNF